jgi:hypothetical protein
VKPSISNASHLSSICGVFSQLRYVLRISAEEHLRHHQTDGASFHRFEKMVKISVEKLRQREEDKHKHMKLSNIESSYYLTELKKFCHE